jgi:Beta-propeller repeat
MPSSYSEQFFTSGVATAQKLFTDNTGNLYTIGSFSGSVEFGLATSKVVLSSVSGSIFITKADSSGNHLWAKQFGGFQQNTATGITVDGLGNIYTAGYFEGIADLDPGSGIANFNGNNGSTFISKLDANGTYLWAKATNGSSRGIAADAVGNLYTSTMGNGIAISKLDTNGNDLWTKQIGDGRSIIRGTTYLDRYTSIGVDSKGNVYTTGDFVGTVDVDPGAGTANLSTEGVGSFIIKLGSDGSYLWANQSAHVECLAIDNIDNVYTAGANNFISKIDSNGSSLWSKEFSGTSFKRIKGITVDRTGNVYTTGYFQGTADFDPGDGTALLTSAGVTDTFRGNVDLFVSKLDSSGNYVWAKQFGNDDFEDVYDIKIDILGDIYTAGTFRGTVDFDPGAGVANLMGGIVQNNISETPIRSSSLSYTSFISKLNAAGDYVTAQLLPAGLSQILNIFSDNVGNLYTTGVFRGAVDFDLGTGRDILSNVQFENIFVTKSDSRGNHLWAKQFSGITRNSNRISLSKSDASNLITVDGLGNVYTTGYFNSAVDFDPGVGTAFLTSPEGKRDAFISKLDSNGNYLWARQFNASLQGITIDSLGNVYTTGYFSGAVDFDPGNGTAFLTSASAPSLFVNKRDSAETFISKLDSNGNYVWAKQFFGIHIDRTLTTPDGYGFDGANNIAVDSEDNIYATGIFGSTVDFDPGEGLKTLTSAGAADIFISKLDGNGNYIWAKSFGNASDDIVNGISLDGLDNIYITGTFEGTEAFGQGYRAEIFDSAGETDIFIQKLDKYGNYLWAKQLGGSASDIANNITVDRAGNVYTTGQFTGAADFDPGPETVTMTPVLTNYSFVSKLDSEGNYIAAQQNVGQGPIYLAVDGLGNLYTAGRDNVLDLGRVESFGNYYSARYGNVIRKWAQNSSPQTDLILQNPDSGEVSILGLEGSHVAIFGASTLFNGTNFDRGREWKLISGKSDLNGDRIGDFVWFNTATGESVVWYMKEDTEGISNMKNAIDSASYIYLPNAQNTLRVGAGWQLTAVANLLGDDRPEFLWENRTTGASAIWQLNLAANGRVELNLNTSGFIKFGGNIVETGGQASGWKIAGVGNFDGNTATKDLLWFNETTSEMAVWQLNGTTIAGFGYLNYRGNTLRPGGWKPVAIGNIDGVGTDEIVLQNGTSVATWTLGSNFSVTDKSTILSQKLLTGEQIQGLADLNADGTLDLLARQKGTSSDSTQIYYLNAVTFQLSTPTPTRFITQARTSTPYTTGDRQWDIIDAVDLGGPLTINNL